MSEAENTTWQPDGEEAERLRSAFSHGDTSSSDTRPPLDPATIWDAATGEASAEERAAVVDRLGEDTELALEWQLAHALEGQRRERSAASRPGDRAPAVPRAVNDNRRQGLAIAATVLTLLAIGLFTVRMSPDPEPVYRSGGAERSIEAPDAPGTCSPAETCKLTWHVPTGQSTTAGDPVPFELTVFSAQLEPLFEARVDQPEILLPEQLLREHRGKTLLWQVTTSDESGVLESPTFSLDVVASSRDSTASDPR